MEPRITIQMVLWNSADDFEPALKSLSKVPSDVAALTFIDNASMDDSVGIVRRRLPQARIIELATNTGFGGGHNAGLAVCTTPYVFFFNPDLELIPESLTALADYLDAHPEVASVQGKLLRSRNSNLIDSCGIEMSKSLNGHERGAQEVDRGQYEEVATVAAVTGAASLHRLTALREVREGKQNYFDADFIAYKEDVDLGWRLRRSGWGIRYIPLLVGWHERHVRTQGRWGWRLTPMALYARLSAKRTQLSFRNWIWMLAKNMRGRDLLFLPFVCIRLGVFIFLTLLYWPFFKVWWQALRGLPTMLARR